jgi:hypothetical protein
VERLASDEDKIESIKFKSYF